jgi:hypothetical protein
MEGAPGCEDRAQRHAAVGGARRAGDQGEAPRQRRPTWCCVVPVDSGLGRVLRVMAMTFPSHQSDRRVARHRGIFTTRSCGRARSQSGSNEESSQRNQGQYQREDAKNHR